MYVHKLYVWNEIKSTKKNINIINSMKENK